MRASVWTTSAAGALASAALLVLTAACGSSPTRPDGDARSFIRFAVTGDLVAQFNGSGSDETLTSFAVLSRDGDAEGFFVLAGRSVFLGSEADHALTLRVGPVDGPGEFDLPVPPPSGGGAPSGATSAVALATNASAFRTVLGITGGTLTITEVADGLMRGTFTATAEGVDPETGDATSVELTEGAFRLRLPGGGG